MGSTTDQRRTAAILLILAVVFASCSSAVDRSDASPATTLNPVTTAAPATASSNQADPTSVAPAPETTGSEAADTAPSTTTASADTTVVRSTTEAPSASPTTTAAPSPTPTSPLADKQPEHCTVEPPAMVRTDVTASGNRLADGSVDLSADPQVVDLGGTPVWVLPYPVDTDGGWYVALQSGTAVFVGSRGTTSPAPAVDGPPVVVFEADEPTIVSAYRQHERFENPLPDTRVVHFGEYSAALVDPTDRYGHDVLGDDIEAGAVQILNACTGMSTTIVIDEPSVIEGISPILTDLDADGVPEVLVTTSNDRQGARLVVYGVDGSMVAQSNPIGSGYRWRNQMGVAPLGPNDEMEIVDVRIPHLGGVVEFFQVDADRLIRMARTDPYTSHRIDSPNLDMGVLVDTDGDTRPEVVLAAQNFGALVVLERTEDGIAELAELDLDGLLRTNIAVDQRTNGSLLAVGTSSDQLYIWGR